MEDNRLIEHLIDIKQRLTHLDTKLDNVSTRILEHEKEDDKVQDSLRQSMADLAESVNKGKGALIAVSFVTAVLGIFVTLQRLGLL